MTSSMTQFHATPGENTEFAHHIASNQAVHSTILTYPFHAEEVSADDIESKMSGSAKTVVFTLSPPVLEVKSGGQFFDANPGSLVLEVGRLHERQLEESSLGTTQVVPLWRGFISYLKRRTVAGAIGRNEQTGASASYRSHRLSPGAIDFSKKGIVLRQFIGSPIYFGPVSDEAS
ncbi:hypothetical protein G6O69_17465 [Pseudenhygromyxa sp. WMMC2535]|uniref:hypothetical protein n=1 Tax=Pseudenhygromyxa sp. WMMC2535 TaxID=2712867 RepID=UPI0015549404|nr:hypothetical protein [Pseudenhygromyxa sp. WMMC2535]NVB39635.1 hypothetical protein [Pseudenhygromyxa sp. WMMC2535]